MLDFSERTKTMDQAKIEENVARLRTEGYSVADENVHGYPVVYKQNGPDGAPGANWEMWVVTEGVAPETLGTFDRKVVPGQPNNKPFQMQSFAQSLKDFVENMRRDFQRPPIN
jgi:hypothetical protein